MGVARVLKPGGIFWIQTCFPNQQVDGFWWAAIIPQAAAKVSAHFPGEPLIRKYLHRSGFSHDVHIELEMEPLMHKKLYYDMKDHSMILSGKEIRHGHSHMRRSFRLVWTGGDHKLMLGKLRIS